MGFAGFNTGTGAEVPDAELLWMPIPSGAETERATG